MAVNVFHERDGCPFCSRASDDVLTRIRYHDTVGANRELPNVRGALFACRDCGIGYCSHIYSLEHFAALYQRLIDRNIEFHRSRVQRLRVVVVREILRRRGTRRSISSLLDALTLHALLIPEFKRGSGQQRVLDVGAGFGDFAEAFQELGDTVETTEVVPYLVDILQGMGLRSHLGELEKLRLDSGGFDLIFMRGSLYRTRDPAATLETAERLLAEGGAIASLDPCPGDPGAEYWARMQFPQGQFYILDCERYQSMLRDRFSLEMTDQRVIYGRPETHLHQIGLLGTAIEFGEMLFNNLLRRKPFMLAYSLRRST